MPELKAYPYDEDKARQMAGYPAFIQRILAARQIESLQTLDARLTDIPDPALMSGLEQAAFHLAQAVCENQTIVICGDYDADGATSTALCYQALTQMGAAKVSFSVPDRFTLGYGLTPGLVEQVALLKPDLILTVDNGISSIEGVKLARQKGFKVVVTDHHLPGELLPDANAIANPSQPGCGFPSKCLAGVGVAFYCMIALRKYLRDCGWFNASGRPEPNLSDCLDLVALGTVADLVPLDKLNQTLVSQGLKRIRAGYARPGIRALFIKSGLNWQNAKSTDLGFMIAPRINAAGRLDSMDTGIECLISSSDSRALALAELLTDINNERRQVQEDMQDEANREVDALKLQQNGIQSYCCYQPGWHQGVVGLVAGRVKDRLHCPVVAFAPAADSTAEYFEAGQAEKGELKGSARSIAGVHVRDCLERVASRHPDLILKYGGHAMAAGLTIKTQHYRAFVSAFDQAVAELASPDAFQQTLWHDGELSPDDFSLENAKTLEQLLPWGQGLPEPCFINRFQVVSERILAERHLKMQLRLLDGSSGFNGQNQIVDAIWFRADFDAYKGVRSRQNAAEIACLYRLTINRYRGEENLQLVILHLG